MGQPGDQSLLKNQALKEVESAETTYVKAIDKLAGGGQTQLDNSVTPLLCQLSREIGWYWIAPSLICARRRE